MILEKVGQCARKYNYFAAISSEVSKTMHLLQKIIPPSSTAKYVYQNLYFNFTIVNMPLLPYLHKFTKFVNRSKYNFNDNFIVWFIYHNNIIDIVNKIMLSIHGHDSLATIFVFDTTHTQFLLIKVLSRTIFITLGSSTFHILEKQKKSHKFKDLI